jgi:hypothetical protein
VLQEFCLQGDREKALGLEVSPMCDRDSVVLCNMQMGFIEFVVAPLVIGTRAECVFCLCVHVCVSVCLCTWMVTVSVSSARAAPLLRCYCYRALQ